MPTAAPTRAKLKVINAISARSRRPTTVDTSMLSSSWRACAADSTGVLPRLTECFGHRGGGIDRENLADDEPVEQHPDRGEMLLDGRLFELARHRLGVGPD